MARIPFLYQTKNGSRHLTQHISHLKIFQMEIEEKKDHAQELKELDDKIADAELNFGDIEVRDAILAKAHFVRRTIGDKEEAIKIYQLALKKTIEIGKKMDINFEILRIHLENRDVGTGAHHPEKVKDIIDECKVLFEKGGDWERKNKLKVYEAVYFLIVRDFKAANELFVSAIPTFNAPEVMTYEELIFYTVMTGIIFMNRADIKKKIIESPEATVQLNKLKDLNEYLMSFYNCNYKKLYQKLSNMRVYTVWVMDAIKADKYLSLHYRYFMRETRIVIYSQFLESYKTVTLETMAREFGVSVEFIDKYPQILLREVASAIDIKRLNCKIDKVSGIIESERTDKRNNFYKSALKKGDHLLNRIQKLSRIIDV